MENKGPNFNYENKYAGLGYEYIAGIDEVGRGCWAGPVVAGAVILPKNFQINNLAGLRDSKLLTPKRREDLDSQIREVAVDFGIGEASVLEIDELGIQGAVFLAFNRAVEKLRETNFLLIDGLGWAQSPLPAKAIIKGDNISSSIAAASIIAKVYRDDLMRKLHESWPQYGFDQHKGYGTKQHSEALNKFGICVHHRKSFAPIKAFL